MGTRSAPARHQVRLEPHGGAPSGARAWLRELALPAAVREDAMLVVSELVTNSLRHADFDGGGAITLVVVVAAGASRVEVWDPGPGVRPGQRRLPGPGARGGRGLFLVQEVADRWGVERRDGAAVWAELS